MPLAPEPSHGVVPALDLDDLDELLRLVESTTDIDGVVGYKLGQAAVLRRGLPTVVRAVREVTSLPLHYDHQKAGLDVPSNARPFASAAAEAGVDGVVLFPIAGPGAVREFVSATRAAGLLPLVGAALPLPDFGVSGGGWIADDVLLRVAETAIEHGASDIIVPGADPVTAANWTERLSALSSDLTFHLPGIGALGGSIPEVFAGVRGKRVRAVVGRAIHAAPDPAEAARELAAQALEFAAP